ncbi:MAG TPA: N-acetylmuramoyl-L-alanine amidase, partial [Verrucomicrobiae bacterium]|nr:N-acetylmuramoyl-L-alanine amidase [Verrucomicrobiae bacterium]
GFPDRGMKRAGFAVLKNTIMPSVLIENLFIDNQKDAARLQEPEFRGKIAEAVAAGISEALNLTATTPPVQLPDWAAENFSRLKREGIVQNDHNLDDPVTWGEMSAVVARILDKIPQAATQAVAAADTGSWAENNFARLRQEGIVLGEHDLNAPVSWGEMSAVIARVLDRM